MKRTRFHVSLYIIIPVIFSGMAAFAAIVAFQITQEYMKKPAEVFWPVLLWALAIAAGAFLCGLVVVRLILNPVEKFVKRAEQLPALAGSQIDTKGRRSSDQLQHFTEVFDQVAEVLGKVEARELFPKIIGQSRAMRGILSQIMKVAPTETTVLISGDSGTGKELAATSIQQHSLRKGRPMVKLNCVAIPESLLESELFGHERGAFTGAESRKFGKFELAHGGTLFLDEIGDMPLNTQAKVLRALQEREIERVGGTSPIKIDVRFIAATNKNLSEMVDEGTFRQDLYYRLNVFSLYLPPLIERKEDISILVQHFLQKGSKPAEISSSAMHILLAYSWPGNVRQLENVIERAAVMSENGNIEVSHLPPEIRGRLSTAQSPQISNGFSSLDEQLREIEKGMIIDALLKTGGVQVRAAEFLGINQRSLWHRIKKYHIDVKTLAK
ncbi:sigma-54 interaction domain-containing protein [Thermodesulfobacteriota bacterium]